MSSNNQIVIIRGGKGEFEVHLNSCVDNDFEPLKRTLLKKFKTLELAIKFANDYCAEEMVEYGYRITENCLK